ncbi:DUF3857 domain-containing transglutaminase family protein [Paraburkholderia caledonica]|uniref:Transglutaminase-like putative cysteine protease n=1 Tax=Paraburkholderia caledonica TaxID=134536 RepID=A0AB73ILP0_9BURK|nr:transglutaminase-like putative cysteine protease [Paraburkholderia caledonica]
MKPEAIPPVNFSMRTDFSRHRLVRAASLCVALVCGQATHASEAPDYRVTQYERALTVDDAGRVTAHVKIAIVLSSDAAVQRFSQYVVPYVADLQTLKIDDAQMVHSDGNSVRADLRTAVLDRPAPTTVTAPQFSSEHLRIVAFPATARGDTLRLSYTLTDRATLFPGKFTEVVTFPPTEAYGGAEETLDTPAGMVIHIDARGVQKVSDTTTRTRRVQVYRYRTPPDGPVPVQADAVAALDAGPYLVATNFSDYAEIGQVYEQTARPQATPSAAIRALADKLTANATDRRQQATLIYDWVSRNIRYLAAYVGTGPVVPHSADVVLRDGYGDCKDHVALFIALLNAKSIRADNVLVNLGNSYRVPDAPTWSVYNHAIAWLPEFGLFADTTGGFAPFGVLSFPASDKPALDTATGKMLHTPAQNGENSASSIDYTIQIRDDGNTDVTGTITLRGQVGIRPARLLSQYPKSRIGYDLLRQAGLTGTMDVGAGNADRPDGPLRLELTGTIDEMAIMPGPAALAVPTMPNYGSIKSFADFVLREADRPLDGPCGASALREHYSIQLPASVKIIAIPPDLYRNSGELTYSATYRRNGQTVEIERDLARNFHANVCSGETLKQWSAIAREISNDLKRQILYR